MKRLFNKNICICLLISPLLLSSLTACGGKAKKAKPAAPCATGISSSTCGLNLSGVSTWGMEFDTTRELPQENGAPAKSEKFQHVTVITEFKKQDDGLLVWRRTSTAQSLLNQNETNKTMFVEGRIVEITEKTVRLTLDRSSCDGKDHRFLIVQPALDADGARTLYYQRSGTQLSLRTRPFPETKLLNGGKGGLGGFFSNMIVGSIAAVTSSVVDSVLEALFHAFTFGLMKDQLREGNGTYHLTTRQYVFENKGLKLGQFGCVSSKDKNQFIPDSQQSLNW